MAVPALREDAREVTRGVRGSKMTQHAVARDVAQDARSGEGARRARWGDDRQAAMRDRRAWWKRQTRRLRVRRVGAAVLAAVLVWMWCVALCAGW